MNIAIPLLALAAWTACIVGVLRGFRSFHLDNVAREAEQECRGSAG